MRSTRLCISCSCAKGVLESRAAAHRVAPRPAARRWPGNGRNARRRRQVHRARAAGMADEHTPLRNFVRFVGVWHERYLCLLPDAALPRFGWKR